MPRYQSIEGKWYPVKEYHVNAKAKPGENPIYEGPDRAALEVLKREGTDHLGKDIRMNPDLRRQARELGYTGENDIERFLEEIHGVDLKENKKRTQEALETKVHTDEEVVTRKKTITVRSGGDDTSGQGKGRKGGFGDPSDVSSGDLSKRG